MPGKRRATFRNWNGSVTCHPSRIATPSTRPEIRAIVRQAARDGKRIRVVGRGVHTYGKISMCDTDDIILDLRHYNQVLSIDKESKTITAQAGIALEDLLPHIEHKKVRLALRNMGEIAEQCLGGVTGTGTHGSGGGGRSGVPDSFSDQVVEYKIMECTPQAKVYRVTRGSSDFAALQTHLGALAIILEVTIQLVDWYHLKWQSKSVGSFFQLTLPDIKNKYEEVYSLSYTYFPVIDELVEVVRDKTTDTNESGIGSDIKDDFINHLRNGAGRVLRVFPGLITPYAKVQKRALLTLNGSDMWRKVLSQGDLWGGANLTLLTDVEYAVPIDLTLKTLGAIRQVFRNTKYSQKTLCVVGIRFVRASPAIMACHYSSDPNDIFAYFDVQFRTKKPDFEVLKELQARVMELGGRPHWGKYNTTTRQMIEENDLWPAENLKEFLRVKSKYDPANLLGNAYLDKALGLDEPKVSKSEKAKMKKETWKSSQKESPRRRTKDSKIRDVEIVSAGSF